MTKTSVKDPARSRPAGRAAGKAARGSAGRKAVAATETGTQGHKPVRHFMVDRDLFEQVSTKAEESGTRMSTVVNDRIREYGQGLEASLQGAGASRQVPDEVREALSDLAETADTWTTAGYLAALADAGWSMAGLAQAMPARAVPERKLVDKQTGKTRIAPSKVASPTREAVRQWVKLAKDKSIRPPEGLPVPQAPTGPPVPRGGGSKRDVMVRVSQDDYDRALKRAEHEGLTMTVVLRRGLSEYLAAK